MTSVYDSEYHLDLHARPVPLLDIQHQSILGGFDFNRLQLGDFALSLLLFTADFRTRAHSYRGFLVGAGAMAVGDNNRFGRMLGYNVKLDETDRVNIHAEDLVLAKAQDMDYGRIAMLAVIGLTQEDHASGKTTETLHPCGRCRGRLSESPLIGEDTLIVTARPDFTVIELSSIGGLRRLHETGDTSGIDTYYFQDTPKILSPLPKPPEDGQAVSVEEIDDSDWEASIGLALKRRYIADMQPHQPRHAA